MRWKPIIAVSLLACVPVLSGCAKSYEPEPVLPVRAEVAKCPAIPLPPAELLKRPVIVDFLPPSIEARPNN